MILIADSGSTKCNWAYCTNKGKIIDIYQTIGFNPKFSNKKSIISNIKNSTLYKINKKINKIYFYGAGCSSNEKKLILLNPLKEIFPYADIHIKHDLEAAIKATYEGDPIISCILGTGSNSCIYDGENIIENAPSLGYILGDEASGNFFGKKLINLYVNNALPADLTNKFENWTSERKRQIINNIYTLERPNLYLASFFKFMYENKHEKIIDTIFNDGISLFFDLHIKCFNDYNKYNLTFVGSVAYYLKDYIIKESLENNIKVQDIVKNPINRLVKSHFLNKK